MAQPQQPQQNGVTVTIPPEILMGLISRHATNPEFPNTGGTGTVEDTGTASGGRDMFKGMSTIGGGMRGPTTPKSSGGTSPKTLIGG